MRSSSTSKPVILTMVGYYLPGYKAGGIVTCVANIVGHLSDEFEFRIVTRDRDLGDKEAFRDITPHSWMRKGDAFVYYLPPSRASAGELRKIVRETPHDLIYLNSFFDALTVKHLMNRKAGFHSKPVLLCPQGEFALPSLGQKLKKKKVFIRMARTIGLYAPVVWHASSPTEADDIRRVMAPPAERIRVASQLPPLAGIIDDRDELRPEKAVSATRIAFLSRISPEKNLDFALRALQRVSSNVIFDIIGPVEKQEYWQICEQVVRQLPSNVSVNILGPVVSSQVLSTLSQYDLLLFPSKSESYGQVIAESILSGTEVLTSIHTPWRNLESLGLGWDLPIDDVAPFVDVIEAVCARPRDQRSARRRLVRENARKYLASTSAVLDVRKLFRDLIGTRPVPTRSASTESPPMSMSPASSLPARSRSLELQELQARPKRTYQVCSRCIMDTTDSNLRFDAKGECEYCQNFDRQILPHWHTGEAGAVQLEKIAKKIRLNGKGRDFDCIIGVSGGLDSSYAAYVAKERMGLRPLLFHVDAGWNTDQAVGNIEKLVDGLGLDLFTEVIDWEEMKDLQVAMFRSQIAHQDIPQDTAFFSALYQFASKENIKYVITGGNFSTECCREPEEWGAYPGIDKTLILDIHSRFGKGPLERFPIVDVFTSKVYYTYFKGMKVIKPLNLIPYIKNDAERELNQRFGWEKFQHKHFESRFTRFFEDFWLPRKFGFDRRKAHFSSLILTNQMTRDAALARITEPELDSTFLENEFTYIANKLGLSNEEFLEVFHGENKTCDDYKNKRALVNLGAFGLSFLGIERRLYK